MKKRLFIVLFLVTIFSLPLISQEKKEDSTKPPLGFYMLKQIMNRMLAPEYMISHLDYFSSHYYGYILRKKDGVGFPFFIKIIMDPEKLKQEKFPAKFKELPARKEKDGTIVVMITQGILFGVKPPLNGYGSPREILLKLNFEEILKNKKQ